MWENLEAWKWIGVVSVVVTAVTIGLRAFTQGTLKDTLHPVDDEDEGDDGTST